MNNLFVLLTGKNYYYNKVVLNNQVKRLVKKSSDNKFLFILSPPFCGSTLLNQVLSSSKSISVNNEVGTREGQKLPLVKDIMFNHKRRWDETLDLDWVFIKKEWMKYWDTTCPILLEKSPPNIIRAQTISDVFKPSYFIVFYRNPYAHCESIIRRNNTDPLPAAEFAIMCLRYQKGNIESLHNILKLSYEELTEQSALTIDRLTTFLPEVSDINIDQEFTAHNFKNKSMKLTNLNHEKIKKLTSEQLDDINSVFQKEKDILSYFNYAIEV